MLPRRGCRATLLLFCVRLEEGDKNTLGEVFLVESFCINSFLFKGTAELLLLLAVVAVKVFFVLLLPLLCTCNMTDVCCWVCCRDCCDLLEKPLEMVTPPSEEEDLFFLNDDALFRFWALVCFCLETFDFFFPMIALVWWHDLHKRSNPD